MQDVGAVRSPKREARKVHIMQWATEVWSDEVGGKSRRARRGPSATSAHEVKVQLGVR